MTADKVLQVGLVAGEHSGDMLGADLLQALAARVPALAARGVGGERMRRQGMHILAPAERLAVMGLVEPLRRLPGLLCLRRALAREFLRERPAVFVGIDAPDFNLGLERRLRSAGIPVAHYVSPSVWAWRSGRIATIRRSVDLMLTLFPFEQQLYATHGVEACYVGHPLADRIAPVPDRAAARTRLGLEAGGPVIAVLPGSRAGELARLAPPFLDACELCLREVPALRFVLPAVDERARALLATQLSDRPSGSAFRLLAGDSHAALEAADLALVACGTATLEAMLFKLPMVTAYRMAGISHALISRMLRTRWVALPNILAGEALVPELLQDAVQPRALADELLRLLHDEPRRAVLRARFDALHAQLRCGAAERAAEAVLALARRGSP